MRLFKNLLAKLYGESEDDVRQKTEATRRDIQRRAQERGDSEMRFEQSKEASVLRSVSAHPKRPGRGRT